MEKDVEDFVGELASKNELSSEPVDLKRKPSDFKVSALDPIEEVDDILEKLDPVVDDKSLVAHSIADFIDDFVGLMDRFGFEVVIKKKGGK